MATTDFSGTWQSCQIPRKKAASETELFSARASSAPPLTAMICRRGTGGEKAANHRSLDETPDEEEDDLVENGDGDEERHICTLGRLGNRLPVDRVAENVDQCCSGDRQREDMADKNVIESRHRVAA